MGWKYPWACAYCGRAYPAWRPPKHERGGGAATYLFCSDRHRHIWERATDVLAHFGVAPLPPNGPDGVALTCSTVRTILDALTEAQE